MKLNSVILYDRNLQHFCDYHATLKLLYLQSVLLYRALGQFATKTPKLDCFRGFGSIYRGGLLLTKLLVRGCCYSIRGDEGRIVMGEWVQWGFGFVVQVYHDGGGHVVSGVSPRAWGFHPQLLRGAP